MSQLTKNFQSRELQCRHCGQLPRDYGLALAAYLEELRSAYGKPIRINSAYRCKEHPAELRKRPNSTHAHTNYYAVDIRADRQDAYDLLAVLPLLGWTGVGVRQKGDTSGRFIHADRRPDRTCWSY